LERFSAKSQRFASENQSVQKTRVSGKPKCKVRELDNADCFMRSIQQLPPRSGELSGKPDMTPNDALNQMTEAMVLVMVLSMPPIIVASFVGIVVSLLQALTQIQEQTLSFAVKLIAVALTIAATAGFLGSQILVFTLKLFNDFPRLT
jgi:type III secretion protein S